MLYSTITLIFFVKSKRAGTRHELTGSYIKRNVCMQLFRDIQRLHTATLSTFIPSSIRQLPRISFGVDDTQSYFNCNDERWWRSFNHNAYQSWKMAHCYWCDILSDYTYRASTFCWSHQPNLCLNYVLDADSQESEICLRTFVCRSSSVVLDRPHQPRRRHRFRELSP